MKKTDNNSLPNPAVRPSFHEKYCPPMTMVIPMIYSKGIQEGVQADVRISCARLKTI